jgi:predicted RNA-binding Zn ribbon-like protein
VNFDSYQDAVVTHAVELVNATTPGKRRGRPYTGPQGQALVAAVRGALPDARRVGLPQAEKVARWARRLRTVFEQVGRGDLDAAAHDVNALLDELRPTPHLDRHDGQPWHLHFHGWHDDFADAWAGSCTVAIATVLGGDYADRLGVCSAGECDRVYVDVSRNGTRRFCSTACQSRVKAAAHRTRAGR